MPLRLETLPSPIGLLRVVTDGSGSLIAIDWEEREEAQTAGLTRRFGRSIQTSSSTAASSRVVAALEAYFAGDIGCLRAVAVNSSGTPFQELVWSALRDLPAGSTVSYMALAISIGRPSAVRAVGLANGSNPVPIVVPCHRVIGANGSLVGFGGGIDRKRWLLAHEGAIDRTPFQLRLGLGQDRRPADAELPRKAETSF